MSKINKFKSEVKTQLKQPKFDESPTTNYFVISAPLKYNTREDILKAVKESMISSRLCEDMKFDGTGSDGEMYDMFYLPKR